MEISAILNCIDSGQMALPEFQRGYVWNRKQVRELFDSLYHRHPVGGLLVWATESSAADHRGSGQLASGIVKLLLDGQQRITSLYGVYRGKPPEFFDGNQAAFTGLRFHLEDESFEFYQPVKMKDDPLWIDVSELMAKGTSGISHCIARLSASPEHGSRINEYMSIVSFENSVDCSPSSFSVVFCCIASATTARASFSGALKTSTVMWRIDIRSLHSSALR